MSVNIEGVIITNPRKICDDRGKIIHIMKSSDEIFNTFGEVYCSTAFPGIVKGWHIHKEMTLNYVTLKGMIKLVLYDEREGSPTKGVVQEIYMGDHNYVRVTIPPMVWNGYMCIGLEEAFVVNLSDIPHDANEIMRCPPHENNIPYSWPVLDR